MAAASEDYRNRTRQFYDEVINGGNLDALQDFIDAELLTPAGRADGIKSSIGAIHRRFPNARIEVEKILVDGEHIVACWRMTGGDFGPMLSFGQATTNEPRVSEISGVHLLTIRDGKVREIRSYADLSPYVRTTA
jgi:predicted ester cyclase